MTYNDTPGLVSIIMGVFNCADTLPQALDSLLAQSYECWELLICDDGSQDSTFEVAKRYGALDRRIRPIKNERNVGLAPTLNRCLAMASGEFIGRMDGDDISAPDRFTRQVNILKDNANIDIVSSSMSLFDEGGTWGETRPVSSPSPQDFVHGSPFSHGAALVRRSALLAVGGYSEADRHRRVEDYNLWLRMHLAGSRGLNILDPLYCMRNDEEASGRRTLNNRINEAGVTLQVIRGLRLPLWNLVYVVRPLLLALLPGPVYLALHRQKRRRRSNA